MTAEQCRDSIIKQYNDGRPIREVLQDLEAHFEQLSNLDPAVYKTIYTSGDAPSQSTAITGARMAITMMSAAITAI